MIDDTRDGLTDETADRVYKCRKASDAHLSEWREKASTWYDLTNGKQWTTQEEAELENKNRIPVVFNRVGAMVNAVCGSEVGNRQEVKYIPRRIGAVRANEIMNFAAQWARDECDAEDEESDAFRDLVICGYGWTESFMDYETNPEGCVDINRRDPFSMRYDPNAQQRNLANGKWVQADHYFCKEDLEERWPEKADEVFGVSAEAPTYDSEPHDASEAWRYINDQSNKNGKTSSDILVIHHCWYETKPYFKVLDLTGKVIELPKDKWLVANKLPEYMGAKATKFSKRVYMEAWVCGSVTLEEGEAKNQEGFPYECMTGYRDQSEGYFYGIVRGLVDPQKFGNRFLSSLMHIFSSNAKGGLVAERGAIENESQFEESWAKADSISYVNQGALVGGKIQPKTPPAYPAQAENIMSFSFNALPMVSGINVEMLGMADRQQAGVLEAQRTKAAITILATLFDSLRQYRKRQGRTLAFYITNFLSDGRIIRITGNAGDAQYIPLIRDESFSEYDVIVDEAVNARDVKERTWAVLQTMLPLAQNMGIPLTPALLDYSPLPSALAAEWKQEIFKRQQEKAQRPQQPDPYMQKVQAEISAKQQLAQADMQIKQQAAEFELQNAQQKAQADAQLAITKAQIEAQTKIEIAKINATTDLQIEAMKQTFPVETNVLATQ